MHLLDTLMRPVVSEKSFKTMEHGVYVFKVHPDANKHQVKQAVETGFDVHVAGVRIMNVSGKKRRFGKSAGYRSNWKKAYVTLAQGERIAQLTETL